MPRTGFGLPARGSRIRRGGRAWAVLAALLVWPLCLNAASDPPLIRAVRDGNLAVARALARIDVDATQGDGATALHWAAHLDDLGMVDLLIRAGARVSAANDIGVTPLHLACENRGRRMVEALLAAGANPNAATVSGETVLMTCSRTGEAGAVRALLARGADVNVREPAHDQTALMWAAARGHTGVVAALLEQRAEVRARSRIYPQTVTSEVTQRAGREALNYTVLRGGSTALLFAARSGDAESARLLLEAGAGVDETLPTGMTALVEAAHSGHEAVGILLLEHGADPNAAEVGYTALHAAVLRGGLDLVKALLTHGADPNARITRGTPVRRNSEDFELPATLIGATPYLLAAKFLEPDIMRVLAAGGADARLPLRTGETPLMTAAGVGASGQADRRGLSVLDGGKVEDEGRAVEAVKLALAHGSDVTAANQAGDTALHGAAALGYDTVIQVLVDAGAQPNTRNGRKQTPLTAIVGRVDALRAPGRANRAPQPSTVELLRALGGVE